MMMQNSDNSPMMGRHGDEHAAMTMDKSIRATNLILLYVLNGFFIIIGLFFNSIVVFGLLKSHTLLKKPCFFMILVLTCSDLVVVTICHPLVINSTYLWWNGNFDMENIFHRIKKYSNLLVHFSFLTLLTMSIDRFLAITYPLFHHVSVTKKRLMVCLLFFFLLTIVERVLAYNDIFGVVCYAAEAIFIGALLVVVFVLNCKMFIAAKAAHKGQAMNSFKKSSTCLIAVACFVVFSAPLMVYSGMQFAPNAALSKDDAMLFNLWASTLTCINSSVNCFIFFWKNNTLRQVGMKILKTLFCRKAKTECSTLVYVTEEKKTSTS